MALNPTFQDSFDRNVTENPLANSQWGRFQETGSNVASLEVVNTVCQATTVSVRNVNIVTGISFANDQWAEVTISGTPSTFTSANIRLRSTSGNPGTSYCFTIAGTNWLIQVESGVTFTTLQTVAGAAIAAGDVLRFEAVGTTLTGYKNGSSVITITDSTLASGSPGININPGTTTTNLEFSLFRAGNFSFVAPTLGIWTNRGCVIGEVSADTPGQPNVLYESGAVILSGTVFKMWFGSANGVCYAESNDGLAWTRYVSNPVLVPTGTPSAGWNAYPRIYKSGSTYYAYVVNPNLQSMSVWTSADGVTWAQQNANAIALQSWSTPSLFLGQLSVAGKVGSTYYGYYTAYDTGLTQYAIGQATSTDLINWTNNGANPVLTTEFPSNFCFQTVGGVVYGWTQVVQTGIPAFGGGNGLPSDIKRYSASSPAGPFTSTSACTVYRTTFGEGMGSTVGQVADPSIIEVSGTTYMYATYTATGNGTPTNYRIECFTAPYPISSIVLTTEGIGNIPQPSALGFANQLNKTADDTFTVGDTNFTTMSVVAGYGAPTYANGSATGTTNATRGAAYWTSYAGGANQWATVKLLNTQLNTYAAACVRMSTSGAATYYAVVAGGDVIGSGVSRQLFVQKFVAGTFTDLYTLTLAYAVGDTITIAVSGTTISAYYNNNLLYTTPDTDISSGSPGFYLYPDATPGHASISEFSAGNTVATVVPTTIASGNAGSLRLRRRKRIYAI